MTDGAIVLCILCIGFFGMLVGIAWAEAWATRKKCDKEEEEK